MMGTMSTNSTTSWNDDDHPSIDMAPLLLQQGREEEGNRNIISEEHPDRKATISAIGDALKERGYFYARNVNVLSADYLKFIYEYSERIHSLPTAVKRQFASQGEDDNKKGAFLGYSGMDIGQAELAYNPGTVASVHAWDYSRTRIASSADDGDTMYPGVDVIDPPYEQVLDDLYERQNVLARALMEAFAECLDLPSNAFVDMFEGSSNGTDAESPTGDFGTIRLLYYPGMDSELAAKANVGISAHTDFEAFTLMHQSAPGLQLMPTTPHPAEEGKEESAAAAAADWFDAPVRPGEFLVIVGDALERCTNGILKATPHRVVKTTHPRWSIIRFNAFASHTMLEPLPHFLSDKQPSLYSPVSMKVHMDTTIKNLESGIGAWDEDKQQSRTANYMYVDGQDHKLLAVDQ